MTDITNTVVRKLQPKDKPYEIRDAGIKGLILRVQPSGSMTYYLEYKQGKRVRLGPSPAITPVQARDLAKKVLSEVYDGQDPIQMRRQTKAENYIQFLDETYRPWLELNIVNGLATYESLCKSFPEFHKLSLKEITPSVIEKWRLRRLQEGVKPSTINRQMNDLRASLNRAISTWALISENPFERVKPCKTDTNPKVRYLSPKEEGKLLKGLDDREQSMRDKRTSANQWRLERGYTLFEAFDSKTFVDHLKPAVLLSLHTGLRRGELFKLKWENIDFERKILTVTGETSRKSGKTRHIPLNSDALAVLKQWKKQRSAVSQYVFHGADGKPFHDVKTSWEELLTEWAKISNFRWHDLRHTFASKLVMAGVDLNTVRELLGHSDYKMTLRYAHLAPEHKALAVAKLVSAKEAQSK